MIDKGREEEEETYIGCAFCVHTYIWKFISIFLVCYGAHFEAISNFLLKKGFQNGKG